MSEFEPSAQGPLEGLVVVDLTRALSGPRATWLMAGLGATVIKIEDPHDGESVRLNPPYVGANGLSLTKRDESDMTLAVLNRSRLYSPGIRPGLRLRQTKRAQNFSGSQAPQILLLLRLAAERQQRNLHRRIRNAKRSRHRRVHSRNFFQHQHIRNGIESWAAPFFRRQHAAAAQLGDFPDFIDRKTPFAPAVRHGLPHPGRNLPSRLRSRRRPQPGAHCGV